MDSYHTVATVGDIADGNGAAFAVNGKMVAVFLAHGEYHAIDDFCPHMGASLGNLLVFWGRRRSRVPDECACLRLGSVGECIFVTAPGKIRK